MTQPLPRPWRQARRQPRHGDLVLVPDGDGVPHEVIDGPLLKDGDASCDPPVLGEPYWRCAPVSRRAAKTWSGERYGRDYHEQALIVVEHPLGWHAMRTFDRALMDSLCLGDVDVYRLRDAVADYIDQAAITLRGRLQADQVVAIAALARMTRDSDLVLRMLEGVPPLPDDEYRAKRSLRLRLTDGRTSRLYGTLEAFPEHPLTRAIEEAEGGDQMPDEQQKPQQPAEAPQEAPQGDPAQQPPRPAERPQQPAQPAVEESEEGATDARREE